MRKPELDTPSLQSMEGHLQTSMEVWVDNNKTPLGLSVPQMKRRDLRLVGISMQTVASVVVVSSPNASSIFLEGRVLACDAQVVCIYEISCSI